MTEKKTKIVCTLGPACESEEVLTEMVKAGMNVARLNFSHGTYDNFTKLIETIRNVSKKLNQPIAIMQDLQGPKIRVGNFPKEGVLLKEDSTVTLTIDDVDGTDTIIPIQYKELYKDVNANDKILLCDGLMELKVLEIKGTDIICKVVIGGILKTHKGLNVPTASISADPITPKDKEDLIFGLKNNVDYVAISFVKTAEHIKELRELIKKHDGHALIVAKIERHEAVKNIESIIHETDGVMVARGDMGVEISAELVPIIQKRIIHLANLHGKPVITATEMLQSMVDSPRATRAEVSDIANAVFDHTDAVMLSNESAVGKYPVQAVQTQARTSLAIEEELKKYQNYIPNRLFINDVPLSYATSSVAAEMAKDINAKLIVTITNSGFTARQIAKHRIFIPIIAITEDERVQRQLQLVWGINKVFVEKINGENQISQIKELILKNNLAKEGDKIVIAINTDLEEKHISTIVI